MPRKQVRLPTEEEEAAIQRGIAADPENPEWTDEDFARMRAAREVVPEMVAEHRRRTRGPQKAPRKVPVTVRLDHDLVEKLRASGPGWQSRMNGLLRKALAK